jgi:arylsulfatase
MGRWKATWISAPFGVSDWELFDLATDPGEARDLANQRPEVMQRLVALWEAYAEAVGVVLPETTGWPAQ